MTSPAKGTASYFPSIEEKYGRPISEWKDLTLKKAFRAIFAGDLNPDQVRTLIDRWISKASRSRLAPL